MSSVFKRFAGTDHGNAAIDWLVLTAGAVLMAVSLGLTVMINTDSVTGDGLEQVQQTGSSIG
jgi:hypothetical protein